MFLVHGPGVLPPLWPTVLPSPRFHYSPLSLAMLCSCLWLCRVLTELVSKMKDMQMDKSELGCLRAIVLFNPGEGIGSTPTPFLVSGHAPTQE